MTRLGILLCFFLSGFAALLYQTAWLRQLALVFGTSELAVATVLAAYMAGLALGAALAARYVDRVARPIRVYGLIEAGIGVAALAVPVLLALAGRLYVAALGELPELPDADSIGQPAFYLTVAFVVLALPTALMGATLPLLARHAVRSDGEVGPRIALLYATNTAGAVAGTLTAAFVLLPRAGLGTTVVAGVAVNALVFVIAVLIARGLPALAPAESMPSTRARTPGFIAAIGRALAVKSQPAGGRLTLAFRDQPVWILPLMTLSGAVAFFYEVLWTRLLAHVLGSSLYAFATMLAAFLTGIALGGALGGPLARERRRAGPAFVLAQVAIAVLSGVIYVFMQALVPETREAWRLAAFAVVVMLPATVFIGATFPLAVRVLAADAADAARSAARVYGWNTVGAIVGSVLAAFWLIPLLGFEGAIRLAVTVNLSIALAAAACLLESPARPVGAVAALLAVALLAYAPGRPRSVVAATAFEVPASLDERELYFAVGRSSSVLLNEADGYFDLRTNGLPEGSILPRGASPVGQVQQWLTALPIIARPDARSLLLVGLGGGVALENAPASLETIDVVELEPEVVAANGVLGDRRLSDPLADPRVHIVLNDARNALRLSQKRFDVITSQPSHPWTPGASHLFSREFFALAKSRLTEDGVFLQWMSAGFVDEALLKSLTATLADVFANVRLYEPAPSVLLFLASDGPLTLEKRLAETGRPVSANPLYYNFMRLSGVSDLVAALALDETGARAFAAGAPLTTDDDNRMATASHSLANGLTADALSALLAAHDPLADHGSWIYGELAESIDFAYVAARLIADGRTDRASRLAEALTDPSMRALVVGLVRGRAGDAAGVRASFLEALAANPGNQAARFALVQPALAALALDVADARTTELAAGLSATPAAVLRGWRLAVEEDWAGLAALDPELARSASTDLWFAEATQLRADWRTKVVGETSYAVDAVRLIDRALAVRPNLDLLVLRAAAAEALGDTAILVESARYASREVSERLDRIEAGRETASRTELDTMFARLSALRNRLARLEGERERLGTLIDRMGAQLARIQVLAR